MAHRLSRVSVMAATSSVDLKGKPAHLVGCPRRRPGTSPGGEGPVAPGSSPGRALGRRTSRSTSPYRRERVQVGTRWVLAIFVIRRHADLDAAPRSGRGESTEPPSPPGRRRRGHRPRAGGCLRRWRPPWRWRSRTIPVVVLRVVRDVPAAVGLLQAGRCGARAPASPEPPTPGRGSRGRADRAQELIRAVTGDVVRRRREPRIDGGEGAHIRDEPRLRAVGQE